jgi:hypothetical protein
MDCSKEGNLTLCWTDTSRDLLVAVMAYRMLPILSKTAGARGETQVSTTA